MCELYEENAKSIQLRGTSHDVYSANTLSLGLFNIRGRTHNENDQIHSLKAQYLY